VAWRFGLWTMDKGSRETREECGIFGRLGWLLPLVFLALSRSSGAQFASYVSNCWRFTGLRRRVM
jgi:hypothetical protein